MTSDEIKKLRESMGLSRENFAKILYDGCTRKSVYNWETGKHKPSHSIQSILNNIRDKNK
jgi:DNA-binding transcriptional regulator YiaG